MLWLYWLINPGKKQISDTRTAPTRRLEPDRPRDLNINMGVMRDAVTLTGDSAGNMRPKNSIPDWTQIKKLVQKDQKALIVARKFHCPGATMLKEQDRCWGCCDGVAVAGVGWPG